MAAPEELSGARYERLSGSGRAIIQLTLAHGGSIDRGYRELARSLDLSEKTIELTVPRLCKAGWLQIHRRQRKTAVLKLTTGAKVALAAARGLSLSTKNPLATAPAGFVGDSDALNDAQKLINVKSTATARDLAELYLERCSPDEAARIATLQDDYGAIPLDVQTITGHDRLDLGLRDHFEADSRRKRSRSNLRAFMGFDDE
jgi:DNA-binding MarR family transcriptional regulator